MTVQYAFNFYVQQATLIAYCLVYQNSHGATVDEKHNITVQLEGYDQLICTKHRPKHT